MDVDVLGIRRGWAGAMNRSDVDGRAGNDGNMFNYGPEFYNADMGLGGRIHVAQTARRATLSAKPSCRGRGDAPGSDTSQKSYLSYANV